MKNWNFITRMDGIESYISIDETMVGFIVYETDGSFSVYANQKNTYKGFAKATYKQRMKFPSKEEAMEDLDNIEL